jgi:hypothetical protein
MFPEIFTLLQNEGFLMQGCFKAALSGLLAVPNAQPGPFYALFTRVAFSTSGRPKSKFLCAAFNL